MPDVTVRRALLSVYDKTGVVDFARALARAGVELISTGGTARLLREADLPVTLVEAVTGAAEMLDGRVKTLHPAIHAGILANRDNAEHVRQLADRDITPIDMVVVNLYPFEKTVARPDCTLAEAIEMIDIGGPCMMRAAAKNHPHVVVVPGPAHYEAVTAELAEAGTVGEATRARLAVAAFAITSAYDAAVAAHLARHATDEADPFPPRALTVHATEPAKLRCGENPHQQGALYAVASAGGADGAWSIVAGAERMSYNNHVDATAAHDLARDLTRAAPALPPHVAVFIKHTNPCGAAVADDPIDAYRNAYLGDPLAAMGGVLAVNFPVGADFAEAVMDSLARWGRDAGASAFFVEVWVAPAFADDAIDVIQSRKAWGGRARLVSAAGLREEAGADRFEVKRIAGGLLVQTPDTVALNEQEWTVATKRAPTDAEMRDLRLAWLACKHTKSNAITLARDCMVIGTGAGQMSRVMSCQVAVELARPHMAGAAGASPVAASDAFFPFADGPARLADAGVTAVIQPGGSKRDDETIALCDERGLAMVLTGTRHFRH